MANEMEIALRNAASSVAKYVRDAAVMVVETSYVSVDGQGAIDFSQARPVARTVIKLDGDSHSTIPMRANEAGVLEVDAGLYALHQENVAAAVDYRARILNALLSNLLQR